MVGLAVALVKDLRQRPADGAPAGTPTEAVENAVVAGVTEHGDDFVLTVEAATSRSCRPVTASRASDARGPTSWWRAAVPRGSPAADWTPTTARSWNSASERAPAYVHGERTPAQIWSMRSSTPGRSGRGTSATRRCPPRRAPCGPGRTPTRSTSGSPPRAPRPCRRTPCRRGRRRRACRSPGDSWVPANQDPIITEEAPAASASATSRGCRTPPSAHTCLPSSRAAAEHSSTAENCGRPTPVIIRVVHMAPGPDADLDDVGAGLDELAGALGGDHVARRDGHLRVEAPGPPAAPRASGPGGRGRCPRRGSRRRPRAGRRPSRVDVTVDADARRRRAGRPAASTAGA